MIETKSTPMIFTGESVRQIIAGRKTQTRRVMAKGNSLVDGHNTTRLKELWRHADWWSKFDFNDAFIDPGPSPAGNAGPYLKVAFPLEETRHRFYPIWYEGETIHVREAVWMHPANPFSVYGTGRFHYDADLDDDRRKTLKRIGWRKQSPMYMPKDFCRLTLEITAVRPERLQSISESDAEAEGCPSYQTASEFDGPGFTAVDTFKRRWQAINGQKHPWDSNPWVWAITFKKMDAALRP